LARNNSTLFFVYKKQITLFTENMVKQNSGNNSRVSGLSTKNCYNFCTKLF